jgi:hypothetical protein
MRYHLSYMALDPQLQLWHVHLLVPVQCESEFHSQVTWCSSKHLAYIWRQTDSANFRASVSARPLQTPGIRSMLQYSSCAYSMIFRSRRPWCPFWACEYIAQCSVSSWRYNAADCVTPFGGDMNLEKKTSQNMRISTNIFKELRYGSLCVNFFPPYYLFTYCDKCIIY